MAQQGGKSKAKQSEQKKMHRAAARRRAEARHLANAKLQYASSEINSWIRRLSGSEVARIQAAVGHPVLAQNCGPVAKEFGTSSEAILRVALYGKLTKWQYACAARAETRKPLQEAWRKRHTAAST